LNFTDGKLGLTSYVSWAKAVVVCFVGYTKAFHSQAHWSKYFKPFNQFSLPLITILLTLHAFCWHVTLKANLHWERARSCQAQIFVSFTASRSCRAEPCPAQNYPTQ